jgi:hypothetical protein
VDDDATPPSAAADGPARAGLAILEGRSSDPEVCPFLRAIDADGELGTPVDRPASENRCVALGDPHPQSSRQQELVCLTSTHVNCPRYLRGAADSGEPALERPHPAAAPSRAVIGAAALLAAALVVSVGFVVVRGGFAVDLVSPSPSPSTSAVAVAPVQSPSPLATADPTLLPTPAPTPTPTTDLTPSPTVVPTATQTLAPTPSPTVAPTPAPAATSDRFALLQPCPGGRADCYVYVIRAGDNLFSIANYFGVSLAAVYDLNPWTRTDGLRVGRELILPTPTR